MNASSSSAVLDWMSVAPLSPPPLLCSAVSARLFVDLGCRGELPVMPHQIMTLLNIDCSFRLSS